MQLSPVNPEFADMSHILEKGIPVNPQNSQNGQRDQGYNHHHDSNHPRHWNPGKFRVSHYQQENTGFDCVPGLHHPAKQLSGIRVVGWDRVDVFYLFFFHLLTAHHCVKINIGQPAVLCHVIRRTKDYAAASFTMDPHLFPIFRVSGKNQDMIHRYRSGNRQES